MKATLKPFLLLIVTLAFTTLLSSFLAVQPPSNTAISFPYKKAGLSEREAAAHLLSRFAFGAIPGEIDAVVSMGLEKWFEQQLGASLPDDAFTRMLDEYDALKLSNTEIINIYPKGAQVLRMAIQDGFLNKDSVNKSEKKEYKQQLAAYMQQKGLKPQQELFRQFFNQKILRATYSNNQLQEVLTDFWFNHFNVSLSKNDCAAFIPNYERDIIRPNVLGKFETMLLATAKSPAMLLYLDNFSSSGSNEDNEKRGGEQMQQRRINSRQMQTGDSSQSAMVKNKFLKLKKSQGLNENYAREVMELHTLGVDGGYSQQDVTQAARVLTGWTISPMGNNGYGNTAKKMVEKVGEERLVQRGFVHEGDFLFAMNRHDNKEKKILGKTFPENGGYQEGVELLKMLAHHHATARFISKKLAVRFVNDYPPHGLLDKMAKTFAETNGDIRKILITLATSPEFWSKEAMREKTKSPFELAISAVRSLDAKINQPYQLYSWVSKMGQHLYFYQAPTGFPDKGQYWINTGALLNRMNFGLALASQRIPGISFDLGALNKHHEPESAEAALVIYSKLLMPERNLHETVKRLTPLLTDPNLKEQVDEAAGNLVVKPTAADLPNEDAMVMSGENTENSQKETVRKKGLSKGNSAAMQNAPGNNSMLSQVVGIIIGSPEFQRK
ncbi:MAG: DUF1800 domain-containing protein [Chitinophagaceae bacterium]